MCVCVCVCVCVPYLLARLVDVGDVDVGDGGEELGGVELVVGALGRQDLVLLLDLCGCVYMCVCVL